MSPAPVVYLETSALVRAVLNVNAPANVAVAPEIQYLERRISVGAVTVASVVTFVEAHRRLWRIRHETGNPMQHREQQLENAHLVLISIEGGTEVLDVAEAFERVRERMPGEPQRLWDALHVATIEQLRPRYPTIEAFSTDHVLRAALQVLGVPCFPATVGPG